jgi:hypothetical protein
MQFKHPEVLYALFLLLIPILIHLFQLRRFQKIDFTNVAFLKKVTIQTRKSSQLKKWLTLLLRCMALACIIFAFAQPYTASKIAANTDKETVLYIDNSFSMQAKGANGPQLQRALQQLYDGISESTTLSWFTNTETRKAVSGQDLKSEILNIPYVQYQLSPEEVLLKAKQLFSSSNSTLKRLLYISDLQQKGALPEIPEDIALNVVQTRPVATNNISLDTAYIAGKNSGSVKLNVKISKQGNVNDNVPVSLFSGRTLVAKIAANLADATVTTISFDIANAEGFDGRLEITDPNLLYDNSLYFSINTPKKIKVLSINETDPEYITRLFNQPEFKYSQQSASSLNYNDIPDQNFVILNELKSIPASLAAALSSFVNGGGSLLIVPGEDIDVQAYNSLLGNFQVASLAEKRSQEKKIAQIVFEHPLYASVFEKEVINFQHPKVNTYYPVSTSAVAALRFEDGSPFILQKEKIYLCSAPINTINSNFQSSPLIVPTFYNMAIQSLPLAKLYFETGKQNTFAVPLSLTQDEILTLKDSLSEFIPLQQTKATQVIITTGEEPGNSGNYRIEKDNIFIERVSFNFNRNESILQYADVDDWKEARSFNDVDGMFETMADENSINSFWKWFVIFAILFLLSEMLVLKFYKN